MAAAAANADPKEGAMKKVIVAAALAFAVLTGTVAAVSVQSTAYADGGNCNGC
jgi:hypothetical protein